MHVLEDVACGPHRSHALTHGCWQTGSVEPHDAVAEKVRASGDATHSSTPRLVPQAAHWTALFPRESALSAVTDLADPPPDLHETVAVRDFG